jgi:hypothetical protein
MRSSALIVVALLLILAGLPASGGPVDPAYRLTEADSLLLSNYLARIAGCPELSLYAVGSDEPGCEKYPARVAALIAGHEIVRQVPSVAHTRRDSIVAALSRPGGIGRFREKLTIVTTDFVMRFTSETDTVYVWGVLSEGYMWFSARGLRLLAAGHDPILPELILLVGPRFVSRARQAGDFADRLDASTADEPPREVMHPDTPIELLIEPGSAADTVWVEARIGRISKPDPVNVLRGVGGRTDSVVVAYVKRCIYRPAMIGKKPVHAWIRLGVPVPAPVR